MIFQKQNLRLPKVVRPCPIVESICEVRFEPLVPPDAVFGVSYAILSAMVGKPTQLPILTLPPEIREKDLNLRFQPHYKFESLGYVMQLGPRVASVAASMPYPGWGEFSSAVKARIQALVKAGVVGAIKRFGLRYINFIEGDVFGKIDLEMRINGQDIAARETSLTLIIDHHYSHIVRIRKDVNVTVAQKKPMFGSVIDIDSFVADPSGGFAAFDTFFETAHTDEKTLFFGMLKQDFLATLNPEY